MYSFTQQTISTALRPAVDPSTLLEHNGEYWTVGAVLDALELDGDRELSCYSWELCTTEDCPY